MRKLPAWHFDEMKYQGIDYEDGCNVNKYDSKMSTLRDIRGENTEIINALRLSRSCTVIDMGAGSGEFSILAAAGCRRVFSVDISSRMLRLSENKALEQGIHNIDFHQGGFLTYEHKSELVDAVVTQFALHHLPDFWKVIALKRMHGMIKPGGHLYIRDIAYSFELENYESFFDALTGKIRKYGSDEYARDVEMSISSEYVTLSAILRDIIKQSGFVIESERTFGGYMSTFLCRRP